MPRQSVRIAIRKGPRPEFPMPTPKQARDVPCPVAKYEDWPKIPQKNHFPGNNRVLFPWRPDNDCYSQFLRLGTPTAQYILSHHPWALIEIGLAEHEAFLLMKHKTILVDDNAWNMFWKLYELDRTRHRIYDSDNFVGEQVRLAIDHLQSFY